MKFAIEPLVRFLRHPYAECNANYDFIDLWYGQYTMNKNYLVLAGAYMFPNLQRSFFFDLGASVYGDTLGWFVEQYAKSGIDFDHVYAWEANQDFGPLFWKDVPDS